jgi:hypothetical protein
MDQRNKDRPPRLLSIVTSTTFPLEPDREIDSTLQTADVMLIGRKYVLPTEGSNAQTSS